MYSYYLYEKKKHFFSFDIYQALRKQKKTNAMDMYSVIQFYFKPYSFATEVEKFSPLKFYYPNNYV